MTDPHERAPADLLAHALSPALHEVLNIAVDVARALDIGLYLVGGPVRDALMGRPVSDLDLVVEGDAWPAAEAFAQATGGRLTKHKRFQTAVVEAPGEAGWSVDWVTARRERYTSPAALPEVEPASIGEDLARRDFAINALALRLDRSALLDPFDGTADMRHRTIRVLHDASFADDPTRLLRAARFATRLGFGLDKPTLDLALAALADNMIARTSPQRILHELWLTLAEPQPELVWALLDEWKALPQLGLSWSDELAISFAAARVDVPAGVHVADVYVALLVAVMSSAERDAFGRRYNVPAEVRHMLQRLPGTPTAGLPLPADDPTLEALLKQYTPAELRALELLSPPAGAAAMRRYVSRIRPLAPLLTGHDLEAAGLAPGPIYAVVLAEARRKQLQGGLRNAEDARRWLAERLARSPATSDPRIDANARE